MSTSDDEEILYGEAKIGSKGGKQLTDVWIVDSGATWHMTLHRDWFYTYEPVLEGSMFMGNDYALEIVGVGTIKIKMFDGSVCTLQGIRHMKGLKKKLLSIGQLDDLGCKTHIEGAILKVVKGALVVIKAEKIVANLYMLIGDTLQEVEALITSASQEEMTVMWHRKLGDMSECDLKILVERNLIPELKSVNLPFCEHCVISKQHRLTFGRLTALSKHILELIHFDVWESPEMSLGGAKYFVSFIDEYSRRLWVYEIKKKSNVFSIFKEFKARIELESGKKIMCLRIDN